MSSKLFSPLKIRDLTFKNRVFVSPMCMYSAENGVPNNWHLVHLGTRATGGAALVIAEATGVTPDGRISTACLGIWNDEQVEAFKPITAFIKSQNSIPGIQLAHAGRKGSTGLDGKQVDKSKGGWTNVAPSAIPFHEGESVPHALTTSEIHEHVEAFVAATKRALKAGFEVIELHMAHGYLMHQFLSPLSNKRTDEFGGTLENRMRFPLMVAKAVRETLPSGLPLFVRISATDWTEGGWDENQSAELVKELKKLGVDFLDVSTGGVIPGVKIPVEPLYQVRFANFIKKETGILTGAVGLITTPEEAEAVLQKNEADAILLARVLLREPYWPIYAAKKLGVTPEIPRQYLRGF